LEASTDKESTINLLDLIPSRILKWEKNDEGLVILLKPKFKSPILSKHLLPRMKSPYYKIKLDFIGSYMWLACDGKRNVQGIGKMLEEKFEEKIDPLYDRLALFLQNLEKHRFIQYKNK